MTQEDLNLAFDEKVRRGIFKPVARHLTDQTTAEDRLQTAIALTWLMFSIYAMRKGKVLSDGILVHHCYLRAVDLNRDFIPADGHCRNQDVLDPRAYRDGHVEVLHLDHSAEPDRALEIAFAERMAGNPARKWNSALDLESWLKEQTSFDQLLLEKRFVGFTLKAIADDLGIDISSTHSRLRRLGLELAARAGVKIRA